MGIRRVEQQTRQEVLSLIVRNGASSRKEIAEKISMTSATLTHVASGLITDGVLYELGTLEEGKVGRKQVMLDVYENLRYVLGFDVTNSTIRVTLLNVRADILEMRRWDFSLLTQALLDEAFGYLKQMIEKYGAEKILGIGLLMQGYIKKAVCSSLPIQNVKSQLEAIFPLEVIMMNNAKGLAVTESYFGNPCQNYVIIKYGPGIGGVVVANGEILLGSSSHAGELGHIVWDKNCHKRCNVCGKEGCLESLIGFGPTIKKSNPQMKVAYPDLKALLLASEADSGQALNASLETLARAVNIFVDIIDPEKILLAGEIFKEEALYQKFISYLTENNQHMHSDQIGRILNYSEKRLKAAGVIVLNEYFGRGSKSILID